MFKTDIEFTVKGMANRKNIIELKRKLYYILNEYGTMDIMIDIKEVVALDKESFYDMLDDYDIKYGGNLSVVE